MRVVRANTAGVKEKSFIGRNKPTSYEEKVKIVKQLLIDKPNLNTRAKITNYTGFKGDILNAMEKNGDVPNLPAKLSYAQRHRWTTSLGTLSNKKYAR